MGPLGAGAGAALAAALALAWATALTCAGLALRTGVGAVLWASEPPPSAPYFFTSRPRLPISPATATRAATTVGSEVCAE